MANMLRPGWGLELGRGADELSDEDRAWLRAGGRIERKRLPDGRWSSRRLGAPADAGGDELAFQLELQQEIAENLRKLRFLLGRGG